MIGPGDPTLERACNLAGVEPPPAAVPYDRFAAATMAALASHGGRPPQEPGKDPEAALLALLTPHYDPAEHSGLANLPVFAAAAGPEGQERARALVEALYAAAWNLDEDPNARAFDARIVASVAGRDAGATVVGLVEASDGEAPAVAFLAEPSLYSLACADEDELLALWASLCAQVDGPLPDGTVRRGDPDAVARAVEAVKKAEEELEEAFDPKALTAPARRTLADALPVLAEAQKVLATRFAAPMP